jgi:hypothetical protein
MGEPQWKMPLSIQRGRGLVVVDADGRTVVSHALTEEDAREIVRRCNAFDVSIDACEAALDNLNAAKGATRADEIHVDSARDWLRDAITLAKGGGR